MRHASGRAAATSTSTAVIPGGSATGFPSIVADCSCGAWLRRCTRAGPVASSPSSAAISSGCQPPRWIAIQSMSVRPAPPTGSIRRVARVPATSIGTSCSCHWPSPPLAKLATRSGDSPGCASLDQKIWTLPSRSDRSRSRTTTSPAGTCTGVPRYGSSPSCSTTSRPSAAAMRQWCRARQSATPASKSQRASGAPTTSARGTGFGTSSIPARAAGPSATARVATRTTRPGRCSARGGISRM